MIPAQLKALNLFGYAPGDYQFECRACGTPKVGAKGCVRCEDCAAVSVHEAVVAYLRVGMGLADFHLALDNRERVGDAAGPLVNAVVSAFGRPWVPGRETARRAEIARILEGAGS